MGRGRHKEARECFAKAIDALSGGYAHNPYLAMTRARYGLSLLDDGDVSEARRQSALATQAFAKQPAVAPYFQEPLRTLHDRLQHQSTVKAVVVSR